MHEMRRLSRRPDRSVEDGASVENSESAENIESKEDIKTKTRRLEEWEGYAKLAAFQTGQPNFSLYRSFSYLYGRALLELQYDITGLERKLDACDRWDKKNDRVDLLSSINQDTRNHSEETIAPRAAFEPSYRRRDILEQLEKKLKDYGDLLIVARDVAAFRRPSDRDYRSVRAFVDNDRPLTETEAVLFQMKEDFVTLHQGREWAFFDGIFVKLATKIPLLKTWLQTPELRVKTVDPNIDFYDNNRVEQIASYLVTPILCALLVLPIVAMYELNVSNAQSALMWAIVVLVAFVLLFTLAMPLFTKAGRNEMFAASAAYCAVLVVFISNFSTNAAPKTKTDSSG